MKDIDGELVRAAETAVQILSADLDEVRKRMYLLALLRTAYQNGVIDAQDRQIKANELRISGDSALCGNALPNIQAFAR